MTKEHTHYVELVAESAAQKAMLALIMELLPTLVASSASSSSVEVRQALARRLKDKRGEYLYSAPVELESSLKAAANRQFQVTFDDLSSQVLRTFS